VRGTLGLASLDGGQRESGEVGATSLLGPAPALIGIQEALWVHFTVEAGQERSSTICRGLPRITLSMQRVCGEAGAKASLSVASRPVPRARSRWATLGRLLAHAELVLPWVVRDPGGVLHTSAVVLSTPSGPSRLNAR